MFNEIDMKKIIIVYTKETQKYAAYLMQLIGEKDDEENCVVGLKDGSVDAALWNETEYEHNRPTIPSSNYVLFMGDSKLMKQESSYMNKVFDQYGMKFASLGKRAIIYTENKLLKQEEYNGFSEFCKNYGKVMVEKYSLNDTVSNAVAGVAGTAVSAAGSATAHAATLAGAATTWTTFTGTVGAAVALSFLGPIGLVGVSVGTVKKILSSAQKKAKIREEQYKFLTFYSFMELLPKFLEG